MDKDHGGALNLPLYHGKNKADLTKVSIGTQVALYEGGAALLRYDDGNWATHAGRFVEPEEGDPKSSVESRPIHVFVARSVKTQKLWLIQGYLHRTWARAPKKAARKPMPLAEYQDEMKRVKACRELGIDPVVSLPFVLRHCGRSPATVYRDIDAGLLTKATKRGGSSAWPFSAVDAYARGVRPDAGA